MDLYHKRYVTTRNHCYTTLKGTTPWAIHHCHVPGEEEAKWLFCRVPPDLSTVFKYCLFAIFPAKLLDDVQRTVL